ncbi:MAG: probable iron-sulfur binding protein YPO1417 [uncultured Arthrobacter sp.]|uniref:Probable iron-sulfur binding protein YPO1417 n=1 Tax=uncultured Arthrobacter sp. TaxID=114050 RepID=A0A6J4I5Y2_9MICC|nr:pyridoxamine 5'-phosphate oxidase family protein [uncultured Arthrobacter sp.]CAA9243544.1 MAG: probable iron-sulfur binding protein YPO1417 [uncultured Arthrobacter sp.]
MRTAALPSTGFHPGELAVQHRAGVAPLARRLEGMLEPGGISGGMAAFLAGQRFAVLTGRDPGGSLWSSALLADPGFLRADASGNTLHLGAVPRPGDPLAQIPAGQEIGVLIIDLARRRRIRVNGYLSATSRSGLEVAVEQAYGNCPQYIFPPAAADGRRSEARTEYPGPLLAPAHQAWVTRTQTMFLGTTHPTRGLDSSHRGGPPGFIHLQGERLWWPDFPGNNMFNSIGNITVDPAAALLFVDFSTGATLQMTGTAEPDWPPTPQPGVPDSTERGVWFSPHTIVEAP